MDEKGKGKEWIKGDPNLGGWENDLMVWRKMTSVVTEMGNLLRGGAQGGLLVS